jgi:hypothetical protein
MAVQEATSSRSTSSGCSDLEAISKTEGATGEVVAVVHLGPTIWMAKRTKAGWYPSLLWASGQSTQGPTQGRTIVTFRHSSMHSPAFLRLQSLRAIMTTSSGHHKMAHALVTADAPLWVASTSLPTTTAKGTIGDTTASASGLGHPSPNRPQGHFLLHLRQLQVSACRLSPREPPHLLLQLHLRLLQRNPLHLREGKALFEELPLRPLRQLLKNLSHSSDIPGNVA